MVSPRQNPHSRRSFLQFQIQGQKQDDAWTPLQSSSPPGGSRIAYYTHSCIDSYISSMTMTFTMTFTTTTISISITVTDPLAAIHKPIWNLPPSYLHSTVNTYTGTSLSLPTAITALETSDTPQNNNNNNYYYNDMNNNRNRDRKPWETLLTKVGMMMFILAMCIAFPVTLIPQRLLLSTNVVTRIQSEQMALSTGQWCAGWLLRIIPFCRITCYPHVDADPEAAIWVCNHTSMLDVFILLSVDRRFRGRTKRHIKIIYVITSTKKSSHSSIINGSLPLPTTSVIPFTISLWLLIV